MSYDRYYKFLLGIIHNKSYLSYFWKITSINLESQWWCDSKPHAEMTSALQLLANLTPGSVKRSRHSGLIHIHVQLSVVVISYYLLLHW